MSWGYVWEMGVGQGGKGHHLLYDELIDPALNAADWQQREITFRVFLRAIRCINLGQGQNTLHFLYTFRAAILLAVAGRQGPLTASIHSMEKISPPDGGPSLELFRSAKSGSRASVVSDSWNDERLMELCMADASDAESQEARYHDDRLGSALLAQLAARQFEIDLRRRETMPPTRLLQLPLWSFEELNIGNQSEEMKELMQRWNALELTIGLKSSFWHEWLLGFLDGKPLDWELQRRVALIDDAIWEAGPEAVAEEIERIRAEWLAEKLPQAEEIIRDPDDGLFKVTSVTVDPIGIIDRVFDQLDFSLELALRGHNTSGFNEMCAAFRYLEHTSKNCRDDPNAVHMHLRLAREIIEGKLRSGEYQSEDALSALVTAMERHEIQLRADHPVIREAHKTFVAQKLRELGDEKRLEIAQGFRSLQPDSKERLKDEYGLDAETLETDTGPEAQADALKRSGGRAQKMSVAERTSSAIKAADGSAANKATGMMFKVQKLAELLTGLF